LALGELEEGLGVLRGGLPLGWDGALYLRYFRLWPIAAAQSDPGWPEFMSALDLAWGAVAEGGE
jgi:hypothetical protein